MSNIYPPEDDQDDDLEIMEREMEEGDDDDRLESDQREAQEEGSDGNEDNLRQLRRKRQKQRQKENMRKTRDENIILMRELAEAKERLAALEARNVNVDTYTAEQRYNAALQQVQMAETALKEAFETGDGEKAIRAQRLRENSMQLAREANALKEQLKTASQQPATPKMDARSESYAQNWVADNPWFNPNGDDEDSVIARAIDEAWSREALSQGITPASEEYWDELDVRVKRRLGTVADRRKKSVPPVSGRGDSARPTTLRDNQTYLSQERIEALKKANLWDDPEARKKMMQAYKNYDRSNA